MSNRTLGVLVVLPLLACSRSTTPAKPRPPERDPTSHEIVIVDGDEARKYSRDSQKVALPFNLDPQGTSATELFVGFLMAAQGSGAQYASDLRLIVALRHKGTPLECASPLQLVVPEKNKQPEPEPEQVQTDGIYSSVVVPFRMPKRVADVVDRVLECEAVPVYRQVAHATPSFSAEYGRNRKRIRQSAVQERPAGPMLKKADQMEVTYRQECHRESVKRRALRYAHFIAAKISPPDVDYIAGRFAEKRLELGEPECTQISEKALATSRNRIEGEIHYAGPVYMNYKTGQL